MIETKDISVVIQGPITEHTKDCICSVKKHLPDSEIILSTWKNSDYSGIDLYNIILVENEDPGSFIASASSSQCEYTNGNRQILSTKNGINRATRKYTIKLRSDFVIKNLKFLALFARYKERNEYSLFKEKLLTCSAYTRRMDSIYQYPLHISDLFYFGFTEDLKKLFDVSLLSDEEIYYVKNYKTCKDMRFINKYMIEQWMFVNLLKKNNLYLLKDWDDVTPETIEITKKVITGNVVTYGYRQLGIKPQKKHLFKRIQHCYSFPNWFEEYVKYTTNRVGFIGFFTILYSKYQRLLYKIKYRKKLKHIRL